MVTKLHLLIIIPRNSRTELDCWVQSDSDSWIIDPIAENPSQPVLETAMLYGVIFRGSNFLSRLLKPSHKG